MRTAPRDDLIAANTAPGQQGLAFGLHRSMDTMGAVLGPLVALALVQADVPLRWIFAIAVIPGLLSVVAIVFLVREHREEPQRRAFRLSLPAPRRSAGCSPGRCSSRSATPATPSSCSRPRTSG